MKDKMLCFKLKIIEEEINGEFRTFIYLDWQIIGYNYKGEIILTS